MQAKNYISIYVETGLKREARLVEEILTGLPPELMATLIADGYAGNYRKFVVAVPEETVSAVEQALGEIQGVYFNQMPPEEERPREDKGQEEQDQQDTFELTYRGARYGQKSKGRNQGGNSGLTYRGVPYSR